MLFALSQLCSILGTLDIYKGMLAPGTSFWTFSCPAPYLHSRWTIIFLLIASRPILQILRSRDIKVVFESICHKLIPRIPLTGHFLYPNRRVINIIIPWNRLRLHHRFLQLLRSTVSEDSLAKSSRRYRIVRVSVRFRRMNTG